MAERKGKKSQKKAEQVQEMPVLAKNKQDVLELGELDQYYFGEGTHYDIYKNWELILIQKWKRRHLFRCVGAKCGFCQRDWRI